MTAARESVIDSLLVRVHFIIVMIRWTGLVPWEFEFPFPGSLTSTFLNQVTGSDDHDLRFVWDVPAFDPKRERERVLY